MFLNKVLQELSLNKSRKSVFIPSLWIGESTNRPVEVDYTLFLKEQITEIINSRTNSLFGKPEAWTKDAVIYNVFIRFFSAYDHDQDGIIGQEQNDITINKNGIRETGTFLKTIALLPYIKSLGINTIHLLPITTIGIDGRKGDLGSPYAIKNPFEIDPLLADPIISLPIEDQYKALVEAAHLLGIRVVQEFIFRTASIDADWTNEHPDWFYWIGEDQKYGAPKFNKKDLEQILKVPKDKGKFIAPNKDYRNIFKIPSNNLMPEDSRVASAFADWPPDDLQPPWTDVTYLRLFNYDYKKDNNYNYIAYNTIRFYDPELAKKEHINHDLWKKISSIIPYYQETFGIDGAMIDMGHALPKDLKSKIIEKARIIDPSFAFWDENFDNKEDTKKEGYNAVIGDTWHKITKRTGLKKIIKNALHQKPLPQFGAAETHNSPRFSFGDSKKKKAAWLLFNILPNEVPFLHNGFELNEHIPVNTGLNFSEKEIAYFSKKQLPLFNKSAMDWDTKSNIVSFIKKISDIREAYPWIFEGKNLSIIESDNPKISGFKVSFNHKMGLVLFNTNYHKRELFLLKDLVGIKWRDLLHDKIMIFDKSNELHRGEILLAIQE